MSLQVFPTSTIFYEKLRSERLHINHEQSILSSLNSVIDIEFKELSKKVWICRHEQELLHQLINSGDNVSPENCYQLLQNLHTAKFIEAYKILSYYAEELIQIYKILALSPKTVSLFLNAAEKINSLFSIDELCLSIFNMLYNACFFPEDERRLLELLIHLITIQLIESPDPRKILRKGNSTFSRMYRYFSEALPLNKIFLTAALHDPIMFLLSQDDLFLDIDPLKSPIRIPTAERHRRFGVDEKSSIYQEKFAQHRKNIVNKLVHITEKFINSIVNAIPIFPKSIKWLVCQMHNALIEKDLISKEEAALISTDLIFTYFICSAVINPEPLGIISDTPISYVARFNLMQIGQLLQTLAILPYEQQFPAYYNEILSRLNQNSMTKIMDLILSLESGSIEAMFPAQVPDLNGKEVYKRRTFVGTLQEINVLQSYLKAASIEEIDDINLRENLKNMIKRLPEKFDDKKIRIDQNSTQLSKSPGKEKVQTTMRLKSLADRVQTAASRSHQRLMQTCSVSNLRNFHHSSSSSALNSAENNNEDLNSEEDNDGEANKKQVVLIFSIVDNAEPIGLASEKEIMDGEFNFNEDNATKNEAFLDAKRKLQLVLSCGTSLPNNANFYVNRENENNTSDLFRKNDEKEAADIHHMLKLLLAESINNNEQKRTAQIREVQRCLSNFDNNEIAMLLRKMKEQQCERIIYIQYLQKSRLTLLQLEHCLKKMKNRIERETSLTSECLVEILVRFSLQKKDQLMRQFVLKFQRLKVQDEKIDLVESHLRHLFEQLVVEPMWRFATLENIEYARKCLERTIMTHIYVFALFPNGDADYYRDEVLNKSIDQLSKQITVDHVELAIPKGLHAECPWPSVQAELVIINAYKSPRDKMACITRCCETIENLIILSPGRNTASADDILPILVFVIIKANPPALLSNIQFIDGFYAKRMQGGEEYWWTQFNSAVEFLKTLLNKLCN